MDNCLFCKIIKGDIPSTKVYEDDKTYAFRDIAPMAPTHVLVVPKAHVTGMSASMRRTTPPSQPACARSRRSPSWKSWTAASAPSPTAAPMPARR